MTFLLGHEYHPLSHVDFCTVADAALYTGEDRSYLMKRANAGDIRTVKSGSKTLIDVVSLKDCLYG